MSSKTSPPDWQADYTALIQAGTAASTRRAYARDGRYFWAWAHAAVNLSEHYPVAVETVIRFVLDHVNGPAPDTDHALIVTGHKQRPGPLKISTLDRYLASLVVAHQVRGVESPTRDPAVRLLLRRARAARAHEPPRKKAAITRAILERLLATCDDTLAGMRDRALLLVGFAAGGRRRSELAALAVRDLRRIDDGFILMVRRSKTDQAGRGLEVPVLGRAAVALSAWLVQSGIREGKLFRGIRAQGALYAGLSGKSIGCIVKRRVKLAGLDPDRFGVHSLRAGFITEAARHGAPLGDAMSLSGHRCVHIASGYYREAALLKNPAADLLSDRVAPRAGDAGTPTAATDDGSH